MTEQQQMLICELCYTPGKDVAVSLAMYRDAKEQPFQSIARCKDVEGCRRRVEQSGERWPLVEKAEAA